MLKNIMIMFCTVSRSIKKKAKSLHMAFKWKQNQLMSKALKGYHLMFLLIIYSLVLIYVMKQEKL